MTPETFDIIEKSRQAFSSQWRDLQKANESLSANGLLTVAELNEQSSQLLSILLNRLSHDGNLQEQTESAELLNDHLNGLTLQWKKLGLTPRETIGFVFNLKAALLSILQSNITDPAVLYSESRKLDNFMDGIGMNVFESRIREHESEILRQAGEINEIRTPIIEVWEGIIALPIIGTLDSSRTQDVMEELLQRIAEDDIHISIVDISGVAAIDTTVAHHLMKLVSAVRLLGADCIISGIRPEIAQTIVNLGIDLEGIVTKSSLADALALAFRKGGLSVGNKLPRQNR